MKKISYILLSLNLLLFCGCASPYISFKKEDCDFTHGFNTTYKTNLTLNQMAQELASNKFQVSVDTIFGNKGKWISPQLKIWDLEIEQQKLNWIDFIVFENSRKLIFYGFCLKKPLNGNKEEQKKTIDMLKLQIENQILPLLF